MHSPSTITGEFVGQGINSVRSYLVVCITSTSGLRRIFTTSTTLLLTKMRNVLKDHGVRAFDLLGAIGSGKTALIERLVPLLTKKGLRAGAIAGDVYGDDDFKRIVALGIPGVQCKHRQGMSPGRPSCRTCDRTPASSRY